MTDATQTSDFTLIAGCACPLCAAPETVYAAVNADAAGIVQLDAQGFLLDVSNPLSGLVGATMSNGMTVLSAYESAMQIARPGGSWADYTLGLSVTYTFDATLIGDGYAAFRVQTH